jgi:hypothetical protein
MIIARKTTQPQYEEKLYSTGDDYLDELLERAFCEGYEYAQKEFGRTGLSDEQAKQFFTKTGNRELNKATNKMLANKKGGRNIFRKAYDPLLKGKHTNSIDNRIKYGGLRGGTGGIGTVSEYKKSATLIGQTGKKYGLDKRQQDIYDHPSIWK